MLEHIIFVSRGASNDTALTMRARTWGGYYLVSVEISPRCRQTVYP